MSVSNGRSYGDKTDDNYKEIISQDFPVDNLASHTIVSCFHSHNDNNDLYFIPFNLNLVRRTPIKQHVDLPLYDHKECTRKYKALGISVSDNQVCAGGVFGADTCDGDSGNPLMKITTSGYVVEGVVSFGRGCGLEGFPAVYTKVSAYDNWIRKNLRP